MRSVGLVVPVYNVGSSLQLLMKSMDSSRLTDLLEEIVIVDDGSTDEGITLARRHFEKSPASSKWKIHSLPRNLGRFAARRQGAEQLSTDLVLFLDCRVQLPPDFAGQLTRSLQRHQCLMAHVEIDVTQSLFDLYWERTHRWAFKKHYRDLREGLWLDENNYDRYLKGTGALLCSRTQFIDICASHAESLQSDDTLLMKELAARDKIFVTQDLKIFWHPRRELMPFLRRLFERGPGFVEYHVLARRGLFFCVFIFSLALFGANLFLLFRSPWWGMVFLASLLFLLSLSTFLFSRGFLEGLRLAPLHVASIVSYFLGSLWGLVKFGFSTESGRESKKARP